jgi:hypothetical protein
MKALSQLRRTTLKAVREGRVVAYGPEKREMFKVFKTPAEAAKAVVRAREIGLPAQVLRQEEP